MILLKSVYKYPGADEILYNLLKERNGDNKINISHDGVLPSFRDHQKFIKSKPYRVWFIVLDEYASPVGSIYISKRDEIGIFIFRRYQGRSHAADAIRVLIECTPRKRYIANINPLNEDSIRFFEYMGFSHIQNSYEFTRKKGT